MERVIGTGGMATVYLAHDLKHQRRVALKVVKRELASVLGIERFLEEIAVTAQLQHPHILPLFDSGTVDGLPFYVMPFVDGESLEQRLQREKQLPIDDAVAIALTVSSALAYAHERGVVHRDIKPANILLQGGQPVVTDFGIALAVSEAGGTRLTETGLSIGTPQYMSAEQASGRGPIDARTDQYALACVVYEMLVGEPPHTGPTAQAILSKVVTESPRRIRAARDTVPPHVEMAIHRALAKLPADRYQTVAQFSVALTDPSASRRWLGFLHLRGTSRRSLAARISIALLLLAVVLLWLRQSPSEGRAQVARFEIPYPTGEFYSAVRHAIAISPDGSTIAYVGQGEQTEQLFLRRLDQLDSRVLPGTEGSLDPFFSPDGAWVGYATVVGLVLVSVTGGEPVQIVAFPEPRGPSWGSDGMILFGSTSGLWRVPASGGTPERISTLDSTVGEVMHSRPQRLPGSDVVLFTITARESDQTVVAVLSPRTGEIRELFPGLSPQYSTTGHIVYGRSDGMLMGVPFDARRLTLTAPADTLLSGLAVKETGTMDYAVSGSGNLVYLTGAEVTGRLVLVNRTGAQEFLTGAEVLGTPVFSRDGQRILVSRGMPPIRDIWMLQLADRSLGPVTMDGRNQYYPLWSPDGTRVVFTSESADGSADLRWKEVDVIGASHVLVRADSGTFYYPESWSPDGRYVVARRQETRDGKIDRDLWVVPVEDGDDLRRLFDLPNSLEDAARLSPDGNWLAFTSDMTGQYEVYVTRFPNTGRRIQVTMGGGTEPAWSPDGKELFYRQGDDMISATVDTSNQFRIVNGQVLFTGRYLKWPYHTSYDVHPDGQRFAMVVGWGAGASQSLVVVLNWFEEMRQRVRSP